MIKQVHLKNFRCFRDVMVDLDPFTVLIGKNDTGKSSFLTSIAASTDESNVFRSSSGDPWWIGCTRYGEKPEDLSVTIGLNERSVLRVYYAPGVKRTRDVGEGASALVGAVSTRYRLRPEHLRESATVGGHYADETLDALGRGLPAVLDRILSEHKEAFEQIEASLHGRMPMIRNLRLRPIRDQHGSKTVGFDLTSGARLGASDVSDGVMLVLAFLTIAYDEHCPRVLLVEEPENGIHPKQLREVLRLLYSLTQRKKDPIQVILTTHSPYVLDFVPASSVRVFRRDAKTGDVEVLPFAEVAPIKEMLEGGYTPGEAWYNIDEDHLREETPDHASPRVE